MGGWSTRKDKEMLLIYNIYRNGVFVRQLASLSREETIRWVWKYMPDCTFRFSHAIGP